MRALLRHHGSHIAEQLVQFADTLLNVADLALALDDQRLLEVDFVLGGEVEVFLLLELLLLAGGMLLARGGLRFFEGGASGRGGRAFLLQGTALDGLELIERGLEFASELLLGVFLGRLRNVLSAGEPEDVY